MTFLLFSCGEFWEGGDPATPRTMTLERESIDLMVGDSYKVPVAFEPDNLPNRTVWWESDDEEVATIDHGRIVAQNPGTVIARATSISDQLEAECLVNVWPRWFEPYDLYPYDMVIYATFTLNGQPLADDVYVGAFWGSELRGVAQHKESQGHPYTVIRIWSNSPRHQIITFRHYNAATATMVSHPYSLVFEDGKMLGMPSEPFVIELENEN